MASENGMSSRGWTRGILPSRQCSPYAGTGALLGVIVLFSFSSASEPSEIELTLALSLLASVFVGPVDDGALRCAGTTDGDGFAAVERDRADVRGAGVGVLANDARGLAAGAPTREVVAFVGRVVLERAETLRGPVLTLSVEPLRSWAEVAELASDMAEGGRETVGVVKMDDSRLCVPFFAGVGAPTEVRELARRLT